MQIIQVSTATAKQRFSYLINQVFHGGKKVLVTSRGKPKVMITAVTEAPQTDTKKLLDDLKTLQEAIRKRRRNKPINIVEAVSQMRQERDEQKLGLR